MFALPFVGRRRKASEAGYLARPSNFQGSKRQHVHSSHKKEVVPRETGGDLSQLEIKKTKSAYPVGDKPFTALF